MEHSELWDLGENHGCLTGDCSHMNVEKCVTVLHNYIGELTDAGKNQAATIFILQEHLKRAGALLVELVGHENDSCYHDHHGACQTHCASGHDGNGNPVCYTREAREFIATLVKHKELDAECTEDGRWYNCSPTDGP